MKSVGSFGILSFLLVHLCILKSTDAVTTAELDLYRRVKPVLTSSDVYADAAKFTVDIQNPIGGRFVKCGNLGTHVVQLAPPSNPSEYSFAYNVSNKADGFIVGNLAPNTDYVVRVACRFNNEGSPGYWSDPISIRTREWTSKGDGSGHHHHYDHDHQQDGGGGGRSKFGGQEAQSNRSPKHSHSDELGLDLPIPGMLRDESLANVDSNPVVSSSIDAQTAQRQFYGVLGEWANLTCVSGLSSLPLSFEWVHLVPSSHENATVKERFGLHILQEESVSTLMMIVKTEDMYGQYICESTETATGQKEQQRLALLKGRRPPRIHLIPEFILMTTASFRVEPIDDALHANSTDAELIEKYGAELPFAGYLVWIKPACHLLGEWIPGNVTELENGFRLNNLHPNEGYYVKAAQRNTGAVGDFGEYWKIRTSSAALLKSSDAVPIRACIFVGSLTLVIALLSSWPWLPLLHQLGFIYKI